MGHCVGWAKAPLRRADHFGCEKMVGTPSTRAFARSVGFTHPTAVDAGVSKEGDHKGRPYGDRQGVGAPLVGALFERSPLFLLRSSRDQAIHRAADTAADCFARASGLPG
jgi:hypothetical protein